jgi:hypothetical protein
MASDNARYARSSDQRLRLLGFSYWGDEGSDEVRFSVQGTSNKYEVAWEYKKVEGDWRHLFRCSCPDHVNRQTRCKHIYFCFSRVLKLDPDKLDNVTIEQLISSISAYVRRRRDLSAQNEGDRRQIGPDDECPICFEPLANEATVWCMNSCRNNIHKGCMLSWIQASGTTCPLCRAEWSMEQL